MQLSPFNEQDLVKLTKFLNFLTAKVKMDLTIPESIEFFHLLRWVQSDLHKKMKDSVAEITSVKHKDD